MTINDLPKELANELVKKARQHDSYIKLMKRRNDYISTGQYVLAMQTFKAMSDVEETILKTYMENYTAEVRMLTDLTSSMQQEDKDMMNALGSLLTMLADMLETAVSDSNQLLNKYHPEYRIEMFDKLVKLGQEARSHVRLLDLARPSEYYTNLYGDTTDKLYELSINKAKSFVNKLNRYEKKLVKDTARNAKVA